MSAGMVGKWSSSRTGLEAWAHPIFGAPTRNSIAEPWSAPFNLGPNVNTSANETRPSLSWDGKTLLFGSNRPGVEGISDIFYTTRDR